MRTDELNKGGNCGEGHCRTLLRFCPTLEVKLGLGARYLFRMYKKCGQLKQATPKYSIPVVGWFF